MSALGGKRTLKSRSSRLEGSDVYGAIHEIRHVIGRVDRKWMLCEAGARRDVLCHLSSYLELSIRAFREDSDYHVLKRDNSDAELD